MENSTSNSLLKPMFNNQEWQFLLNHLPFTVAVHESGDTLDDVERLVTLGEQLLQAVKVSGGGGYRNRAGAVPDESITTRPKGISLAGNNGTEFRDRA